MPLTIEGSLLQRLEVQSWLRRICTHVDVDLVTGEVTLDMTSGPHLPYDNIVTTGCDCLRDLINGGPGQRRTIVHLLDAAHQRVPQRHDRPASDKDPSIRDANGGATVPRDEGGAYVDANGNPGRASDGQIGSDVDVYIDYSDYARRGYDFQGPKPQLNKIECPQWIILAHELTSGHASWCIKGEELSPTSKGVTAATYKAVRENRAIRSEQSHRATWGLHPRPLKSLPE
jgi:hypothetical protein